MRSARGRIPSFNLRIMLCREKVKFSVKEEAVLKEKAYSNNAAKVTLQLVPIVAVIHTENLVLRDELSVCRCVGQSRYTPACRAIAPYAEG
jgi:hypothetical protein